jgi:kynurenine 3-monooxygenase
VPWQNLIPVLSETTFPPGAAQGWISLYTMVTFRPDISYATAQRKAREQAKRVSIAMMIFALAFVIVFMLFIRQLLGLYRDS